MQKSIFPIFEDIERGYCIKTSYAIKSKDGEVVAVEKPTQNVLLYDEDVNNYIEISIKRNRSKKRKCFKFKVFGQESEKEFKYNEDGWNDCILEIKKELQKYRKIITYIMNEGYDFNAVKR